MLAPMPPTMRGRSTTAARRRRLAAAGASPGVIEELLSYDRPLFGPGFDEDWPGFPLPDEAHLGAWILYVREAKSLGAAGALAKRFPQLHFPIQKGISQTDEYRRATRQGIWPEEYRQDRGVALRHPGRLSLTIHPTLAGRIPLLVAGDRADFEALVRAFSARNEPVDVPRSMGACIVTGLNNWNRVQAYRRRWEASNPLGSWPAEFARVIPRKELYEDRFLILSRGPYSGVSAADAGFSRAEWASLSLLIRREHECTHYLTFRLAGTMRNNLLDEVLADYVGLVRTFGGYRPDLALRFFGLEDFPRYREGARLQNYGEGLTLSASAFAVVQRLMFQSVQNLARLDQACTRREREGAGLARLVVGLGSMTLDELAESDLARRLLARPLSGSGATRGSDRNRRGSAGPKRPTPRRSISMRVGNGRGGIDRAIAGFSRFAARHGLSSNTTSDVHVVLDEILSNIVKHGKGGRRESPIQVAFALDARRLRIEVADSSKEFNLLALPDPDLSLPLGRKPIGGLGIYLVKKLTDEQLYERREGKNRIVLVKNL